MPIKEYKIMKLNNSWMKLFFKTENDELVQIESMHEFDDEVADNENYVSVGVGLNVGVLFKLSNKTTDNTITREGINSHPKLPFYMESEHELYQVCLMTRNINELNAFMNHQKNTGLMATEMETKLHFVTAIEPS